MSEDRFKQARKSLIDRQSHRQNDDDFDDEATSMVNLGAIPQPASHRPDEATEMLTVDAYGNASSGRGSNPYGSGPSSGGLVIGQTHEPEGATQFLNIADLAAGAPAAPSEQNTQFVDINALQAGAGVENTMSVENDPVLKQEYQYGPESIQQGDLTLIFAQNRQGRQVVLKRIWEGDVSTMPMEVRQRCMMLDQIKHPHLIGITGMLTSPTGAWVEMPMPTGYQLTAVLGQNGPQNPELVKQWATQIAQVLAFIHQFQFVYANLTTDSIWVQENGSVLLEPFDIVAFQDRGNLGPFGPPELSMPPQHRQVFPSTDVYSLAAVTVAALAGLPLNVMVTPNLPAPFAAACMQALQQDPGARIPSPAAFAEALAGPPPKKAKGGIPPEHRMKVAIGVVAVVGVIVLGVLSMQKQKPGPQPQGDPGTQIATQTEPVEETPIDTTGLPEGLKLERDPRVKVTTSYLTNPLPEEETSARPIKKDPEAADAARQAAREALKGIERFTRQSQQQQYDIALQKMAEAIRLSSITEEDRVFLSDLNKASIVQSIRRESSQQVRNALKDDKMSAARLYYQQLEKIDPNAEHLSFFTRNKNARATKVTRPEAAAPN